MYKFAEVFISLTQSNGFCHQGINPNLIPSIPVNNAPLIWSVFNTGIESWHGKNVPMIYKTNTGDRYSNIDIFCNYWAGHTDRQVIHFKHARGGSSLESNPNYDDWNVNTVGELYDRFLSNWDDFLTDCETKKIIPIVNRIFWIQYENEVFGPDTNRTLYPTWWKELRAAVDAKIGHRNKWTVFKPHPDQYDYDMAVKNVHVQTFRNIFENNLGKEPSVDVFETSHLSLHTDRIHHNEASVIQTGLDLFNKYQDQLS